MFPPKGWMKYANCAAMPKSAFFPPDRDTQEEEDRWYEGPECALVLRICGNCQVRVDCFKHSLEDADSIANGVFGGTTPKDRARYLEALTVRNRHDASRDEGADQG